MTMAPRGSKKVSIKTSGQEKSMFTVFLHGALEVDGEGKVIRCRKGKPQIIFKGAASGTISREIASVAGSRAGRRTPKCP